MMLQGHSEEVTSVVWCPTDFTKVRQQTFKFLCVVSQISILFCFLQNLLKFFALSCCEAELFWYAGRLIQARYNPHCFAGRLLPVLMTTPCGSGGFVGKWMKPSLQLDRPTWWAGHGPSLPQVSNAATINCYRWRFYSSYCCLTQYEECVINHCCPVQHVILSFQGVTLTNEDFCFC